MQPQTGLTVERRLYRRERYVCHLEVRRSRQEGGRLKDEAHVSEVMTRWLHRCVRDEPIIMGAARVELHREFTTDRWLLRAEAHCFIDVQPEDRPVLTSLVDHPKGQAVELPTVVAPKAPAI